MKEQHNGICPYCKEEIKPDAIKCKHCSSFLKDEKKSHDGICPYCKEEIKPDAIKCKHCKSSLEENSKSESKCGCNEANDTSRISPLLLRPRQEGWKNSLCYAGCYYGCSRYGAPHDECVLLCTALCRGILTA